ncbi:MAG: hypothetical protein ACTTJG_06615 [Treponema sp.]
MIDFDAIDEFDYKNATSEERAAYHEWVIKDQNLDEEEAWYERHSDEFVPVKNQEEIRKRLMEAAKNPPKIQYGKKETKRHVSLRLDNEDIGKLRGIAVEQGLQYQSLIGSVLHRYAMGTLVDVSEVRKVFADK